MRDNHGGHISDAVRADLAKLEPEKKARVLDVADRNKPPAQSIERAAAEQRKSEY